MPDPTIFHGQPVDPALLQAPTASGRRGGVFSGLASTLGGALRRIWPGDGPPVGEYGVNPAAPVLAPFLPNPVPEPGPRPYPQQTTSALGGTGVPIYGGFVTDLGEYNPKLQGLDAFPTYEKMRRSDADCRAGLLAYKLPIRTAVYQVLPGATAADKDRAFAQEIAKFVEDNLFGGLESLTETGFYHSQTWESVIENALLCLDFGCAAHEILWHVDGDKVRIRALAPRLPMTFYRFHPGLDGETLLALEQYGYRGADYVDVIVPAEKIDYFTYDKEGAAFYGRSLLRAAYSAWYIKSQLYRIDAIGQERNSMGIPVIICPEMASDEDKVAAQKFVTMVSANEQVGLTLPYGFDFKLVGITGRLRDPKASVQHHSEQILRSMLNQFLAFGTTQSGSRSLSQDMSTFFKLGLNAVARSTVNTMNGSSIRRLVDFNFGDSRKPIPYPRLIHQNIAALDPMELLEKLKSLSQWQNDIIQPDDVLENQIRSMIGLAPKAEMRMRWMPAQPRLMMQPATDETPQELETGRNPSATDEVAPMNPVAAQTGQKNPGASGWVPGKEPNPHQQQPALISPIPGPGNQPQAAKTPAINPITKKVQSRESAFYSRICCTDRSGHEIGLLNLLADTSKQTVCVDFDGVIDHQESHQFTPGTFGTPDPEALALLATLHKGRYRIAILTARKDLADVEKYLKHCGAPYDSVTNTKPPADAYIDDRGIHWDDSDPDRKANTLAALNKIKRAHHQMSDRNQRTTFAGIPVVIENPAGSVRSGKKPDGTPWSVKMTHSYGYIPSTSGFDGEGIDVFLGPNEQAPNAHVVRVKEPKTGVPDEDKVVLGANDAAHARQIILDNYDDPNYFEGITEIPMEQFREWAGLPDKSAQPSAVVKLDSRKYQPRLYLVRHAHTSDNGNPDDPLSQKVRGSRDVEPDQQGLDEAERVGKEFAGTKIRKIYTSGKKRARIVADAIAKHTGAPIEINPAAESWNRGSLEGQPVSQVLDQMQRLADNPDEVPAGGVSRNQWLKSFGDDLRAKMSDQESADAPDVYVTHLSNIMATPAVVTGDRDLLPFPSDKFRTAEMLVLSKQGDNWRWKKYAHLSDRLSPVDFAAHKQMLDATTVQIAQLLRDTLPGTALLAADLIRTTGPAEVELPFDAKLSSTLKSLLTPVYQFGRSAVYSEREKSGVGRVPPPRDDDTQISAPAAKLADQAVFDFGKWVLSREMAGVDTAADPDDDYNIEGELLRRSLDAAGLPVKQLAREMVLAALTDGRRAGIDELRGDVARVSLSEGLWVAEWN